MNWEGKDTECWWVRGGCRQCEEGSEELLQLSLIYAAGAGGNPLPQMGSEREQNGDLKVIRKAGMKTHSSPAADPELQHHYKQPCVSYCRDNRILVVSPAATHSQL